MLRGAIDRFEELLSLVSSLNPIVVKGYDSDQDENDFFIGELHVK